MKVKIESEEQLVAMTKELLHIISNLRHWTKLWNEHFGSYYGKQKKMWEQRADDYLEKVGMRKTNQTGEIDISEINIEK